MSNPLIFYGDGARGDRVFKLLRLHAGHTIEIVHRGGHDEFTEVGLLAFPPVVTLECSDCGETLIESTE